MAGEAARPPTTLHLGHTGIYVEELFAFLERRGEATGHAHLARGRLDGTLTSTPARPPWLFHARGRLEFLRWASRWGMAADKIVVHGLFDAMIIVLLALRPALRRKTCWIAWGGDLYVHQKPVTTLQSRVVWYLRRFVVARLPQIATHVPGDAALCREWFGWRGAYIDAITYPNSIIHVRASPPRRVGARVRVLAGNSAVPTNNHHDLFLRLARIDDGAMEVHCPLSYGPAEARAAAIEAGRSAFGDRFRPIVEMMPFDRYLDFLTTIDVAAFDHDHQAALGNVLALIGMGKRVFLKRATTTWQHLQASGLTVFDIDALDLDVAFAEREENVRRVAELYSEARLVQGLRLVFAPVGAVTGANPAC